ncbi:hypothetical protein OH799_16895 [Nocardia sp. NBC_00881]|uniref:hypothetical protein n=1 Tax=Nocardia sp. NBC_00881 TaxID=2975995 RepID=UPI003869B9A7|nr:hypothetical protein OH799_16895 [Nocardia sp. NBC_00881]
MAHADQPITVTAKLLDCSVRSRVDLGVLAIVGPSGGTITVSDDVYARLRAAGCFL